MLFKELYAKLDKENKGAVLIFEGHTQLASSEFDDLSIYLDREVVKFYPFKGMDCADFFGLVVKLKPFRKRGENNV